MHKASEDELRYLPCPKCGMDNEEETVELCGIDMIIAICVFVGICLLAGIIGGGESVSAVKSNTDSDRSFAPEPEKKERSYSIYYQGCDELMERLEEILHSQSDVEAETAINDSIVFIRDNFYGYTARLTSADEIKEKYAGYTESMYGPSTDMLLDRLERASRYQPVFRGAETINDAIVYIREHYISLMTFDF